MEEIDIAALNCCVWCQFSNIAISDIKVSDISRVTCTICSAIQGAYCDEMPVAEASDPPVPPPPAQPHQPQSNSPLALDHSPPEPHQHRAVAAGPSAATQIGAAGTPKLVSPRNREQPVFDCAPPQGRQRHRADFVEPAHTDERRSVRWIFAVLARTRIEPDQRVPKMGAFGPTFGPSDPET
jgi:hypothetical protein